MEEYTITFAANEAFAAFPVKEDILQLNQMSAEFWAGKMVIQKREWGAVVVWEHKQDDLCAKYGIKKAGRAAADTGIARPSGAAHDDPDDLIAVVARLGQGLKESDREAKAAEWLKVAQGKRVN